jgi:hypothetical protein
MILFRTRYNYNIKTLAITTAGNYDEIATLTCLEY